MGLINFDSFSLATAIIVFLVAAAAVWYGGTHLSAKADELASKTGVGRAFVGALMLGGITSLPELATTVTAAAEGNAGMAVSNLLGSISMQVAVLACIGIFFMKTSLSTSSSSLAVLLQGICLVLLLAFTIMFILNPSVNVFHIGANSVLLFAGYLASLFLIHRFDTRHWKSFDHQQPEQLRRAWEKRKHEFDEEKNRNRAKATLGEYLKEEGMVVLMMALLILAGGYFVVNTSETIANEAGITQDFAGFLFVAVTTSLPEVSTTLGAVRLKQYDMAFSNIFGTNLLNVAMIFLADIMYTEGPVFSDLSNFTVAAAALGILLTGIFLLGILTGAKKIFFGAGLDALAIVLLYFLGVIILSGFGA